MYEVEEQRGKIRWQVPQADDPLDRMPDNGPPITRRVKPNDLDSAYVHDLWNLLLGHYRRELDRQAANRREMQVDEQFYDGEQWSDEEKAILWARHQAPLVYNVIATSINWMLGTERRGRTDYRVLPRREDGSDAAEKKSQLLKYLSDTSRFEFHVSRSFKDTTIVGVGWLECGVQDDHDGEPIYQRKESWRNVLFDSMAQEDDLSDGRYMFRTKWTDLDVAKKMFPERAAVLEQAANTSLDLMRSLDGAGDEPMDEAEERMTLTSLYGVDGYVAPRRRVRLIEAWFRVPVEDRYMRGGQFSGELFDPSSPGHQADLLMDRTQVVRKVKMRMHAAILCEAGMLHFSPSPYRHNQFPFTPIWGYRRGSDGLPYGVVRNMRDPQSDINKRASKALHILSTNKTVMDEGAVSDLDEFREEASRPDAVIVKRPGKELVMGVDRDLAPAHLDLMSRSIEMLQQQSGITDENLGRTTNATSGKAIIARQDQGSLATSQIFDNLRLARQVHGSKMLSLVEQFMREEKQFRITDMRGNASWERVNDGLPENDIVSTKADFIISEDDWSATMRQAQVEQLIAMMSELGKVAPDVVMATLDLLVETMDVPQREELVKRIRQITGMEDPDADPNNPDPETQARKEAQAMQQQMQMRAQEAEIAHKEAEAAYKQSQAEKGMAERAKVVAEVRRILAETAGANVDTQVKALEAAAAIMGAAGLEGVADTVLAESGYRAQQLGDEPSMGGQAPAPARPAGMPPAQPPQPQQQPTQPGLPRPAQGQEMTDG